MFGDIVMSDIKTDELWLSLLPKNFKSLKEVSETIDKQDTICSHNTFIVDYPFKLDN